MCEGFGILNVLKHFKLFHITTPTSWAQIFPQQNFTQSKQNTAALNQLVCKCQGRQWVVRDISALAHVFSSADLPVLPAVTQTIP